MRRAASIYISSFFMLACSFLAVFHYFSKEVAFVNSLLSVRDGKVKCIIVGDSHTAAGFRNEIPECQNLSLGGTSIPMLHDIVVSALESTDLERIVMALAPHNFTSYRVKGSSDAFSGIAQRFTPYPNPVILNDVVREVVINHVSGKLKGKGEAGERVWANVRPSYRNEGILRRLESHIPSLPPSETDFYVIYLRLVQNLVASGIEVCAVRTPVDSQYEDILFDHVERDWFKVVQGVEALGAKYIDYRNIMGEVPISYLRDQDHLNEMGASIFAPLAYQACFD